MTIKSDLENSPERLTLSEAAMKSIKHKPVWQALNMLNIGANSAVIAFASPSLLTGIAISLGIIAFSMNVAQEY